MKFLKWKVEFVKHLEEKILGKFYTDSIIKNSVTDWSIPKNKKNEIVEFIDNKTNSGGLTDFNDAIIELDI